jgi:hypothetical protein
MRLQDAENLSWDNRRSLWKLETLAAIVGSQGAATMGENNRFFLWVWRFNAILLALLGAALGLLIITNIFPLFPTHNEHADNFLAAPQPPTENVSYDLYGSGTALEGTSDVLSALQRSVEPSGENALRYSSGGRGRDMNTVNLLLVDGANATSHWLFKGVNRIIWTDSVDQLKTITESDAPKSPVVALVIEACPAHPDKSGTMKADGAETLYFYRIGADEAIKFFSADNIRSYVQIGPDRLLVMYQNGQSIGAATFSTRDFKLVAQSRVLPVAQ